MQIQKISSLNNFHFGSYSDNRPTIDIDDMPASIGDIYAAEDRIIKHQEQLLEEQNKLIADAMMRSAIYSAYPNAPSIRENFFKSLEALGGKRPEKI